MNIKLNVKYNDKIFSIDSINRYSSIFRLKYEFFKTYNIDISDVQIKYNGILLKDNISIYKYLDNNSTLIIQTNSLKGGMSCGTSNLLKAIFGGLLFYVLCLFGFIPIIVRIYWLLFVNMFKQIKELLCKYDRLGASVMGSVIGFLVMSGFVHIHNNTTLYFGIIGFIAIFGMIGSKRMISFFEPMFRKDCIYLDPATRTIRKCRPTSPAMIGFIFIALIRILMACLRYAFIFLVIFVTVTYLELFALKYKHSCENYCESLALAKKVGKIATYVYIAFFILFNIPNYILYFINSCLSIDAFPFTLLQSAYKIVESKIKKFANDGKYYISGLYFFSPIIGFNVFSLGFSYIHLIIDYMVDSFSKYTGDFKGYNCSVGMNEFIKKEIELDQKLQEDIKDYLSEKGKITNNETTGTTLGDYINDLRDEFTKSEYIGSTESSSELKNEINKKTENITGKEITFDNKDLFKSKVKSYLIDIFNIIINRRYDLKDFIYNIDFMSERIKNIFKNLFVTNELKEKIKESPNSTVFHDFLRESQLQYQKNKGLYKWFSKDKSMYSKQNMFRKLYCFYIYFINLFNGLVESYGTPDDVKNEMKVSNVAGSACFFSWMVMAIMVATNAMS